MPKTDFTVFFLVFASAIAMGYMQQLPMPHGSTNTDGYRYPQLAYAQKADDNNTALILQATSSENTFLVDVAWTPNEIGKENIFVLQFIDPDTKTVIEDVKYDIMLVQDGKPVSGTERADQTSMQQKYVFKNAGPYVLQIDDIEDLGEGASIPMQVTPEFPSWVSGILGISLLLVTIAGVIGMSAARP